MKELILRLFGLLFFVVVCGCGSEPQSQLQSLGPARLEISPSPIFDFGSRVVLSQTLFTFEVTNRGEVAATEMSSNFFLSLHFAYPGGYPGTGGTCGTELSAGASCQVVIAFTPQYEGAFQDILRITYHNGENALTTELPILKGRGG